MTHAVLGHGVGDRPALVLGHRRRRPFDRGLEGLTDGIGSGALQEIVEVLACPVGHGDPDPPSLGGVTRGGTFGGADAGAFTVIVGEDDDAHDLGWERDVGEIAGRERRPDRQSGADFHNAERGLDALGDAERGVLAEGRQPDGAAGDGAEHHAGARQIGLCRTVRSEIGAMDPDDPAAGIAHEGDEAGIAGAGLPMSEIGMEPEFGRVGHGEAAGREVGLTWRAGERPASLDDDLDLAAGVLLAARLRRGPGCGPGAVLRRGGRRGAYRRGAGELGGIVEQRTA